MGLERDRHGLDSLLPRPANDLLQHMAVSAMYAVKIADAHNRRPEVGRNFFEFVKDFHRKEDFCDLPDGFAI